MTRLVSPQMPSYNICNKYYAKLMAELLHHVDAYLQFLYDRLQVFASVPQPYEELVSNAFFSQQRDS